MKKRKINRKHKIAYFFLEAINVNCRQSVFAEIKKLQFPVICVSLPKAFYI